MAAEGCMPDADRRLLKIASMGPRPDGRGRLANAEIALMALNGLQWGRGRMAAEGANGWRRCPTCDGFNGAAAGWPRKVRKACLAQPLVARFNGAAAGWPRKDVYTAKDAARNGMLQWGRGRMAAEGMTPLSTL